MKYRGKFYSALFIFYGFVFACGFTEAAQKSTRLIIWGDSEGMLRRPGDNPKNFNPAVLKLIKEIKRMDAQDDAKIDLILCTGDFVRFDPVPTKPNEFLFFEKWPKPLLSKFYPTIGGDEEFLQGKYRYFMQEIGSWLKNTIPMESSLTSLAREAQNAAKDQGKDYYYALRAGVHLFSLWSPDNLDEIAITPQYAKEDIFNPNFALQSRQYIWLARQLWQIRVAEADDRPVAILSHRPILNRSGKHLIDLFNAFDVDLVLSGDEHVLAKTTYQGVHYVVTGMMGDSLGGCDNLNKGYKGRKGNHFAYVVGPYEFCIPTIELDRRGKPYKPADDHYLNVYFEMNSMRMEAIRLEDNQIIENSHFATILTRDHDLKLQNDLWQSLQ